MTSEELATQLYQLYSKEIRGTISHDDEGPADKLIRPLVLLMIAVTADISTDAATFNQFIGLFDDRLKGTAKRIVAEYEVSVRKFKHKVH